MAKEATIQHNFNTQAGVFVHHLTTGESIKMDFLVLKSDHLKLIPESPLVMVIGSKLGILILNLSTSTKCSVSRQTHLSWENEIFC